VLSFELRGEEELTGTWSRVLVGLLRAAPSIFLCQYIVLLFCMKEMPPEEIELFEEDAIELVAA